MKSASVLILFLLLAPISTFAQYKPAPSYGVAGMEGLGPSDSCPVSLRAQFLPDGDLIKTGPAHPQGIGQALHLTFSNPSRGLVTEATLLLRGWTPKGRRFETGNDAKPDAVRSQHVHLVPGPNQTATADIWVAGLSAVTSVEIVSATYKNGSAWARPDNLSCGAVPDGFMLVHP